MEQNQPRREIKSTERKTRQVALEETRELLSALGFNLGEIHEIQADLLYLRSLRRRNDEMRRRVGVSIATLLATTGLYLLWETLKAHIIKP